MAADRVRRSVVADIVLHAASFEQPVPNLVNTKETLLDWLRDAHAMESALVSNLEKQSKSFSDQPQIKGKIDEHLVVTRSQRDRLEPLIAQLGGKPSTIKDVTGKFLANVQAMAAATAPDAVVKTSIANFAIENFEIACYRSLIAAAESLGESEVKRVCKQILDEEQEMANWLNANIGRLTTEYLGKQTTARV